MTKITDTTTVPMNITFRAKDIDSDNIVTGTSLIKEADGYVITNEMEYDGGYVWMALDDQGEATDDITYIDITTLEIITNA